MQFTSSQPSNDTPVLSLVGFELGSQTSRLPRYSHTCILSTFMIDVLHWPPVTSRIQYKVLIFVARTEQGLDPKYFCGLIRTPLSALSSCPLQITNTSD